MKTMSSKGIGLHIRWLATAAAFVLAVLVLSSCRVVSAGCDICGRHMFSALAFRVEYADGGVVRTCCPRCASHAVATNPHRRIAKLIAHDFVTGREIDARSAVYVDGSDFEHCNAPMEKRASEDSVTTLAFDRCLPSLVAFASASDAQAFMRKHGGRVESFEEIHFGRP